jgi:serine phosphatase RsbU (regulator of sigma subunit)
MSRHSRLALFGVLAWCAFFWLFPRVNPAARFGFSIDRRQAVEIAREAAARFDIQVENWGIALDARIDRKTAFYLAKAGDKPGARFSSPVTTSVKFTSPDKKRSFLARLSADGRVLGFVRREPDSAGETPVESAKTAAESALRFLAGDQSPKFTLLDQPEKRDKTIEVKYEATSLGDASASPEARFVVRGSTVVEGALAPKFENSFSTEFSRRDNSLKLLPFIAALIGFLLVMIGLTYYLVGSLTRQIQHRSTLTLFGLVVVLLALLLIAGGRWEAEIVDGDSTLQPILGIAAQAIFLILPVIAAFWGAGYMLSLRASPDRVVTLDLLLKGNLRARPVAASLLAGFCLGGAFNTIPYGVVAVGFFPGAELIFGLDPTGWVSPAPVLSALEFIFSGLLFWFLAVFGLLYPLAEAYISRPVIARGAMLLAGTLFLSSWSFEVSLPAALVSGALLMLFAEQVYRRSGLLAILALGISSEIGLRASAMLFQPSVGLKVAGYAGVASLGLLILAWLRISDRGRELDLEKEIGLRRTEAAQSLRVRRAERERLLAEFSVAQKAQAQMLPLRPPDLPGLDVAAVCRPAREVGGDLYDFVSLKDGRWAFVVADVSGKGVPAALYMTLTKGLLVSVAGDYADPGRITKELNGHLYRGGRRGVFVTLALAAIDPEARTIQCVRAGHNPLLWRQTRKGRTMWLSPAGIGLGLAAERLFDRSISVEEIQLEAGDLFVLYSDGITEAMNSDGDEYGQERLSEVLSRSDALEAAETCDRVLNEVAAFAGSTPQHDDITLVVVRVRN